jgi:hypothetical protein
MLFKRRPREAEPPAAAGVPKQSAEGYAILRDELGLSHLWYLELRLKEELARAARAGTTFSIATWEPRLLPGDEPNEAIMSRATGLIVGKLRSSDLVGRVDDRRYVGVLLDADYHHASTVAYRIKADIQVLIPGAGKWRAGVATYGRDGVDVDGLIQVALRRMDEDSQAA